MIGLRVSLSLILVVLLMPIASFADDANPAKPPAPALPPGTKLVPNIEYASVAGKSLLMDLYLPEKIDKPVPVILYVHGGGWTGGDKHEGFILAPMAGHGYAIASINYRFSNEAIYPAQINDCKAAVRWLRAHANFYSLDPSHVGAAGASAGGHLVALLGTTGDVKELEGDEGNLDQSSRVQAVCDFFGPTDFCKITEEFKKSGVQSAIDADAPDSPGSRLIGAPIQEAKDKAARANPIAFVSKDSAPTLIMHGDKDNLVPLAQSEIFRDALQQAGVEVKLEVIKGAGHGFGSPAIYKTVEDFFDSHLKPAKP
jgi:acetyl esterase/lipase